MTVRRQQRSDRPLPKVAEESTAVRRVIVEFLLSAEKGEKKRTTTGYKSGKWGVTFFY